MIKKDFLLSISEAQPILVTADSGLAKAGRKEGLKVWDCLREQAP